MAARTGVFSASARSGESKVSAAQASTESVAVSQKTLSVCCFCKLGR